MSVPVRFLPREPPLVPGAVVAEGDAARALAKALLQRSEELLDQLEGVAGRALLLILGPREALPWVDGVTYLGREDPRGKVWIPVHAMPSVPPDLFERALAHAGVVLPAAVLPSSSRTVSLAEARRIDRAALEAWLRSEQSTEVAA